MKVVEERKRGWRGIKETEMRGQSVNTTSETNSDGN